MDKIIYYAPVILIVLVFLINERLVVTPEQLEKKHREILSDADKKFVSLQVFQCFKDDIKEDFKELKRGQREIINTLAQHKEL